MADKFKWVTIGTFFIINLLFAYGLLVDAVSAGELKYGLVYDSIFLSLLLIFLYCMREKFNQTLWTHSLVMLAIVLHSAGAIFLYSFELGWFQYDMLMHFFSGFALFHFSRRLIFSSSPSKEMPLFGFTAVLVAVGLGGIHEIIEFISYGLAGTGPGLFTAGGDMVTDFVDVNVDLLSGFLGSMLGMITALWGK